MGEQEGTEKFAYQIMDLSESALFLLEKENLEILYLNKKAANLFGEKLTERNSLNDEKGTASFCSMIHTLKQGEERIVNYEWLEKQKTIAIKIDDITLENKKEIVLCTILDSNALLLEEKKKEILEQENYERKLKFMLEYDPLTNISNANHFYKDVGYLLLEKQEKKYAIISLDINRFKLINDMFGMSIGDDVLRFVAQTFKENLPEDALFCRRYSDVFFICVSYNHRPDLVRLIEKLQSAIVDSRFTFDIHISFGIYIIKDRMLPINLMCDRASLAKKTVKDNAVSFYAFYDEHYREDIIKTKEIEEDMLGAIEQKQFQLYLQPKYNLESGKICGAEVLSRWQHPVRGLMQPNEFIPLFEQNGFILKLDEYIWNETCKLLVRWREQGIKPIPLSVNISRYHLKNNNLVKVWKDLTEKYNIPTSYLTLEITETFFYDDEDLYVVLNELQKMGFKVELDDFGSGYSSLNMIRQAPLNTIKIDKEFLDNKLSSDKGKTVINHAIALAKDLKLDVIAEGVETKEHVDFLKSSSCDVAQGYFFAKPMPIHEFELLYFNE